MRHALLIGLVAALFSPLAATANRTLPTRSGHAACSSGYVAAHLSWGDKCLRAGEFCRVGNPEYHAYGFDCPASGHLTTYTGASLVATVTLVRQEADSDLHLVLQAGGERMIAEAPSPSCDSKATAYRRKQMLVARNHVRLCAKARVTGVAFFDFDHGQTGVAPNAIELHPILAFTCLNG